MLVRMNRLPNVSSIFDELFADQFILPRFDRLQNAPAFPPVFFSESPNELKLAAEIPGMKKEDIRINIEKNIMTVSGERKAPELKENEQWLRNEVPYGQFTRSFSLPFAVETEKITAAYDAGVLTVTLPKQESAKAKEITIA